jgi:hypothetical protein
VEKCDGKSNGHIKHPGGSSELPCLYEADSNENVKYPGDSVQPVARLYRY